MRYISAIYPNFRIEENEIDSVANAWLDVLQDIPFELAKEKTRMLCQENTKYHPKPPEIYQACLESRSFYDLLRIEEQQDQLALQAYDEKAVPMPDHILERLERRAKRKVNSDES